ncbi:MAG: hypothetical protein OXF73_09625 [Gammaproteobacteria bacterium]|nr:hypothetical protein [Gammaproteobacteria bacterium]MCY4227844.1 hypothetical protein [Gammaproteobacteria bacterium]
MSFRKNRDNVQTGEPETGTVLDIVEASEPVIRLRLEDGTLVRIKQSILEVMRMDRKNEKGEDVYNFEGSMTIRVIPVEEQEDA